MITLQTTILKLHNNIWDTDLCLVWSSSTLLPTLKSPGLRFFSTIIFEPPLDHFEVQLLLIINDVFAGSKIHGNPEK